MSRNWIAVAAAEQASPALPGWTLTARAASAASG